MTDEHVRAAYRASAAEYTTLFGSVEDMHTLDRQRITQWAIGIEGRVVDVGCGPGHWTNHLHELGVKVQGVDLVPEFIDTARVRFPDVSFRVATLRSLGVPDGSLQGVLAWYSLIHVHPDDFTSVLGEIARALAPGGRLLVGFFEGVAAEPFTHTVTTAYYWSVGAMRQMLGRSGFDVLDVEARQDLGRRPHAAISAAVR
jgi:ubiquinone/menaquinone biosynthesis C-methylase UbiE